MKNLFIFLGLWLTLSAHAGVTLIVGGGGSTPTNGLNTVTSSNQTVTITSAPNSINGTNYDLSVPTNYDALGTAAQIGLNATNYVVGTSNSLIGQIQTATNGLASTNFVLSNPLNAVTNTQGNVQLGNIQDLQNNYSISAQNHYLYSPLSQAFPSVDFGNRVLKDTNGYNAINWQTTPVQGLGTGWTNASGQTFVTASVTNGLATTAYVNTATNGFVSASVTNGLATTNFVTSQGYITSANGGNAATATNALNFQNYAVYSNALAYCNANGNTNPASLQNVQFALTELRNAGIGTNFLDIIPLYPLYVPQTNANNVTVAGLPITWSNAVFNPNGFSESNGSFVVKGFPPFTNCTIAITWHQPTTTYNNSGLNGGWLGGLVNTNASQYIYIFGGNDFVTPNMALKGGSGASNSGDKYNHAGETLMQNYNSTFADRPIYASGNEVITCVNYDGSNVTCYANYSQGFVGFSPIVLTTNFALTGWQITAPLTNLYVGQNFTNESGNSYQQSLCEIASVIVVSPQITNYAQWQVLHNAARDLNPKANDLIVTGDSTWDLNDSTNSPIVPMRNEPDLANFNIFLQSYAGRSYQEYYVPNPEDTTVVSTNWLNIVSSNFTTLRMKQQLASGAPYSRVFESFMGLNDAGLGEGLANFKTYASWLALNCNTNGLPFYPATVRTVATNNSVYSASQTTNFYPTAAGFNNWLYTQTNFFAAGIIPYAQMFNQSVMATNGVTTVDGVHLRNITNCVVVNQQIANLAAGLPQQVASYPEPLWAGWTGSTSSPFTYTNQDEYPRVLTVSGGTITAVSGTGLPSSSGLSASGLEQFTIPPTNSITITYTGSPLFYQSWLGGLVDFNAP